MSFSLDRFERLVWRREHAAAVRELLLLLTALDRFRGLPGADQPPLDEPRCTRIAAAVAGLLTDAGLQFTAQSLAPLLGLHGWLAALFNASAWRDGDAVIQALNGAAGADDPAPPTLALAPRDVAKFCLLYGAESKLSLDLAALSDHDPTLAAGLAIALLSPRMLCTPAAHAKREQLLPWLADQLDRIDDLADLPADLLDDVYMQCSYADRPDKHAVKRAICGLVQRSLRRRGFASLPAAAAPVAGGKPVLLVLVEWFTAGHSMYRTHSRTIEAARACFEVVGMGYGVTVDDAGRQVFDRFVEIPHIGDTFSQLRHVQQEAQRCGASVFYMPSVGMSSLTLFAANLRLAPLQVMGLGHPATAHAAAIDLAVVEADYLGDPACFSERLLLLPPDGMPYRPLAEAPTSPRRAAPPRPRAPQRVHIALCATLVKLNPTLLAACAAIVRRAPLAVHFQLLVGQAHGVVVPPLKRAVHAVLGPHATVHPHQPYAAYRAVIDGCDLFVNPFPFGNTNGTLDCVAAGLVGVCKTGREVHEHIDDAMFRRLGWPGWLIAPTVDAYVDAAVRLATAHDERAELRALHAGADRAALFHAGRPQLLGEALLGAWSGLPA